MKQTKKNRLLTFLAITGLTLGGPLVTQAQDGFGVIRPAKPAKSVETQQDNKFPPIVASANMESQRPKGFQLPPIIGAAPVVQSKQAPKPRLNTASSNAPLPFAASQIRQASAVAPTNPQPSVQNTGFQDDESQKLAPGIEANRIDLMLQPLAAPMHQQTPSEFPPIATADSLQPVLSNPVDSSLEPMNLDLQPSKPEPHANADSLMPLPANLPQPDTATGTALVRGAGYSTAGIPIYSAALPSNVDGPPPIVAQAASANVPPIVSDQESGVIAEATPTDQVVPPQPIPLMSPPPINSSITPPMGSSLATGVPTTMGTPTQPHAIGEPLIAPPATSSPVVSSAMNPTESYVSGCDSCGDGACYDPNAISGLFNSCGSCSFARRYFIADALYYDRDDGVINNSNFGSLNNFDWNAGWRFTLGRRMDSTRGREISYMGTLPVDQNRFSTSPTGIITSRFIPADGFGSAQTSGFFNATQQLEAKQTSFHSLEFNRVRWGWDVLKTYFGFRYLYVDDSYTMYSQSITNDQGFFQLETMNHLFGPHIGAELFYDVGYRMSFSLVSKFGVYANINETDTVMFNNGTQFLNNEDREGTISTSYELGLNTHFRLNRNARLRLGYNLLYLGDVASVSDNFPRFLTPSTVGNATDDDEMFFHGVNVGFEFYR